MKSVLISIQPKWCELIVSGKKTIEVRKTAPKDTLFKVYMYCTKERMTRVPSMYAYLHKNEPRACAEYGTIEKWGRIGDVIVNPYLASKHVSYGMHGKVVGEFVCDKVIEYGYDVIACAKFEVNGAYTKEENRYNAGACLSEEEMYEYSKGKPLRGLHISELKIYDKPKELGEFIKVCPIKNQDCAGCEFYSDYGGSCTNYVTRPPRGWQYVEPLDK